jgi:type I restriction enzyme, S subunit
MKKYEAYRPSGVEWLGEVPAHWEVKRLRFALKATNPVGSKLPLAVDALVSFVPMSAVGEYGGLTLKIDKPLDEIGSGYTYFAENDVVIAKITPCFENGKGAIAIGLTNGVAFGTTELHVLRPDSSTDARFLFYLTISEAFRKMGEAEMFGAGGQKRVPEDFIKNLSTALPPLPEQQAIAAFLDARTAHLDGLIARKEDLLKLLAEQRAARITRAVTRGLVADVPLKESGVPWLGQVPAHWEVKRLKFVADVHSGIAKGKKYSLEQELVEVPYLRVANVQDGYLNLDDVTMISVTPAEAKAYELQPLDVLMNEGGDNDKLGRGAVWEGQVAPCIHQNHVFAIRCDDTVDPYFLSYFFGSLACKPYFLLSGNQATNLASISSSAIADTPLTAPPLAEQRTIVAAITQYKVRVDKMVDITVREIAKLREYRAALITAAVTGRIDVRG